MNWMVTLFYTEWTYNLKLYLGLSCVNKMLVSKNRSYIYNDNSCIMNN